MSRSRTRYQPEPNPVQPIFLTTDPTGCRHARLPIGTLMHHAECTLQQTNLPRNLAGTRQSIRPQPSRQSAALPCHISTDALLRIGRIRRKRIWRVTSEPLRFRYCVIAQPISNTPACVMTPRLSRVRFGWLRLLPLRVRPRGGFIRHCGHGRDVVGWPARGFGARLAHARSRLRPTPCAR